MVGGAAVHATLAQPAAGADALKLKDLRARRRKFFEMSVAFGRRNPLLQCSRECLPKLAVESK